MCIPWSSRCPMVLAPWISLSGRLEFQTLMICISCRATLIACNDQKLAHIYKLHSQLRCIFYYWIQTFFEWLHRCPLLHNRRSSIRCRVGCFLVYSFSHSWISIHPFMFIFSREQVDTLMVFIWVFELLCLWFCLVEKSPGFRHLH